MIINLTKYELNLIAGNRGIKNYQNMTRDELLNTMAESERIIKNLSQNGIKKIARMESLSQNELQQIVKMQDLSQDELEQIARMRGIKDYKNMSREDLLTALLKSKQSHAKLRKSKDNNAEIEETKKIFNEFGNRFSREKI